MRYIRCCRILENCYNNNKLLYKFVCIYKSVYWHARKLKWVKKNAQITARSVEFQGNYVCVIFVCFNIVQIFLKSFSSGNQINNCSTQRYILGGTLSFIGIFNCSE